MKKLLVDCSKPLGQQETVVDMTQDDIDEENARAIKDAELQAARKSSPSIEDRLAALEEKQAQLDAKAESVS